MNEAQTKHDLITPALQKAGWGIVEGSRLRLEFPITKGRLIGHGKRATPIFADYVLEYKNRRIGVVEAKKRDLYYTDGLGQAKNYAERLNIRYTYATNGLRIYGADIDETTFDLSVKNANTPEEAPLRSPEDILEEMERLDLETSSILESIKELI